MAGAVDIYLFTKFTIMLDQMRSWPHHTHLTTQHIDKLRELIDTSATYELAKFENASIALSRLFTFARRVRTVHRAELIDIKQASPLA